jgi:3-oxoacyl-[acyl-carrier protein] reductase
MPATMDLGVEGKLCVVTGASRGIGLETSRRLAAEGAQVLMVARDADVLRPAADAIGAEWIACDITDADVDERVIATCAEQMGGVDVLVNNAGTAAIKGLDELTDEDWREQWELHVMAPMRLMRAAAPRMAQRGGGRIVNVCSSSGKRPSTRWPAYSVSKSAQLSLSRVFADAFAAQRVLVNAVTPGPVATELWTGPGGIAEQIAAASGGSADDALAAQAEKVPIGRLADAGEIADVIAFLCSARASTVTGAAWSADGGSVAIVI